MFMSDNKKKATQIIAGFGAPEEKPLQDGAEVDGSIGLEACAEELIDALHSKDPKAVVAAFQAMQEMSEASEPEEVEIEAPAEEEAE